MEGITIILNYRSAPLHPMNMIKKLLPFLKKKKSGTATGYRIGYQILPPDYSF